MPPALSTFAAQMTDSGDYLYSTLPISIYYEYKEHGHMILVASASLSLPPPPAPHTPNWTCSRPTHSCPLGHNFITQTQYPCTEFSLDCFTARRSSSFLWLSMGCLQPSTCNQLLTALAQPQGSRREVDACWCATCNVQETIHFFDC
mmetsp:Transcript_3348/g.6361  ORF Transcript_3348/g.6361 Transcript_3348/m.6361 type:complete len:147 (-) Transcript_3348:86-526(-)